ncbi:DUF2975 domain-containing protein [Microbacterium rhizomatis]|uniref:DUF2975 domain-containing protein n=1 Tax=Microbacterium rhizomatis TaxID=1631477 RepID=A0A5J5J1E9_9MICO|nr:DUF2975 domain-containing protein [Microbacterium rhizomatis]KAA9106380.1 hypothetical protein F6B43_14585 [Microbacterium rhizomatis]
MNRGGSTFLFFLVVVALVVSAFVEVWVLPTTISRVVEAFPEVSRLSLPAAVWGIAAITCLQGAAVTWLTLLYETRGGSARSRGGRTGLKVIAGFLCAFAVLTAVALVALVALGFASPGVMIALLVLGLAAVVTTVCLLLSLAARSQVRKI